MTTDDLRRELRARGYAVSARRITDWIQKGLLPPRTGHGRGRARGKAYTWAHSAIVEQAIMVQTLLDDYARTQRIPLALWLFGFDVSLDRVRTLLQMYVTSVYRGLVGDSLDAEDVADAISHLALATATRQRSWVTPEIIEAWFGFIAVPNYRMSRTARRDLAVGLTTQEPAAAPSDVEATARVWAVIDELTWLGTTLRQCSLPAVLEAVSLADDVALQQAQQQWCAVFQTLRTLLRLVMPEIEPPMDAYNRNGAMKVGACFVALYLQGRRLGYGDQMDRSLERGLLWLEQRVIPWVRSNRTLWAGDARGVASQPTEARGDPTPW